MRAASALALGFAVAAMGENVRFEGLKGSPGKWSRGVRAAREHKLELTFAVKQRNVAKLEAELLRVSDPESKDYGKHLSHEEVHRIVAPAPEHIAAVESFIRSHGAVPKRVTPSGDFITAEVSVSEAEAMLSAEYHQFTHPSTDIAVHRATAGYSLPAEVAAAVDMVGPTTHLPGVSKIAREEAPELNYNTPKNLRTLYNVGNVSGKAESNKQAVTAFLGQHYSKNALEKFWNKYCDGIVCGKGFPKLVGDETSGAIGGTEAMLDIETITGLAGNIESEFWGFSGNSPYSSENEPFLKWLSQVDNTSDADVPKLFSTSYGEDESSWPFDGASRLNAEFVKTGARGITLLYASGDEGANCKGGKFVPETPSSSPYITAVGGTRPASGYPTPGSEEAIGLSSGGFSNYWVMPDWQKAAVGEYLKNSDLPDASKYGYNVSNRAYPDISAQATGFCVGIMGCTVAGTSCASPTSAAIFSLVNDVRLQNGKSTLGFLNPMIYKSAAAFNDITTGSSTGCGGWPAKSGWDAVTGLGTPDYLRLAKVALELP